MNPPFQPRVRPMLACLMLALSLWPAAALTLDLPETRAVSRYRSFTVFDLGAAPSGTAQDTSAVELGMRFVAATDGVVEGVRFYRHASNSAIVTGSLWSATGERLARVSINAGPRGWNAASFDKPVDIRAGEEYVVSYYTPVGRYAFDANHFNSPVTHGPLTGKGSVYAYGDGNSFPTETYAASNYWVDVDFRPYEESFFAHPTPSNLEANDDAPVELGLRFTPQADGIVAGMRFYKSPLNSGPHIGSLWSANGERLAQLTFPPSQVNRGWQQAYFAKAVPVRAGRTYVVSYHAPKGRYAFEQGYFDEAVVQPPLTAGRDAGVYAYGPAGTFPSNAFRSTNYWVDVVYSSTRASAPSADTPSGQWWSRANFPSAANTGLKVTTTRTSGSIYIGAMRDVPAWMTAQGSGTADDPYVIDRVKFTGPVQFGNAGTGDGVLGTKHFKFTNCDFSAPATTYPTVFESNVIAYRGFIGRLIIEDSNLGPNIEWPENGELPTRGVGRNLAMRGVPFEVRRSHLWGASTSISLETLPTDPTSIIENNYVHGIFYYWDPSEPEGTHNNVINANNHGSNLIVRGNYLNGRMNGDGYTPNCIGIYDDRNITKNWTIDNNYITHCGHLLFHTYDRQRFQDPLIVTRNVFAKPWRWHIQSGRAPSIQRDNVDESGVPVTLGP